MDTADSSSELHPWVVMTEASLNRNNADQNGLIRSDRSGLNVCVSKELIHRSMLIWDRMLKAAEASNLKFKLEKESPFRTLVTVDGEELSISLKETLSRSVHVHTPEEKAAMKRFNHLHDGPKFDRKPSGTLAFTIDQRNVNNCNENQIRWVDGEKKRIEDRLISFADVLVEVAKKLKKDAAWREELARKRDEENRQKNETVRLQAEEEMWIENLKNQASDWEMASSIRRFIKAVREEATLRRGGIEPGSQLERWTQWAEGQAGRIDPVPSFISESQRMEP